MVLRKGKASSRKSVFVLKTLRNLRILLAALSRVADEWLVEHFLR